VREIRYRAIADELRRRVEAGEFAAGRTLPSESELSAAYEASRVTIRKALELLRDEGLVDARQGFGWFAAVDPLRQSLGRLGTIEAQLADSGVR
jgi:GntR family transcriptional regulator